MRRELILDNIVKRPGIGFNEIARQTKLSNGVISHYILQLLKEGEIVKSGVRAKYFHYKISEKDIKFLMALNNNTNYKIIKLLLDTKSPVSAERITKTIEKSRSTVSVNLKRLEKMQIIGRKILNEKEQLTADVGFYILDEQFMRKIFSKYNLNSRK